jgi:hypothetical protein
MITGAIIATAETLDTNGTADHPRGQSRHVDQINAIAGVGTPTNRDSSCSTL